MIIKKITYKDLDGEEITENFYFKLNKSELADLEVSEKGGLQKKLKLLTKTENPKKVYDILKTIVFKAYGERSEDNKRLNKSEELSKAFSETDAYDILFMELISDVEALVAFIEGILPSDILAEAKALEQKEKEEIN